MLSGGSWDAWLFFLGRFSRQNFWARSEEDACRPAGFIVSGPARLATMPLPLPLIGSKELCHRLRFARVDDKVAAVVLRLDTPGTA